MLCALQAKSTLEINKDVSFFSHSKHRVNRMRDEVSKLTNRKLFYENYGLYHQADPFLNEENKREQLKSDLIRQTEKLLTRRYQIKLKDKSYSKVAHKNIDGIALKKTYSVRHHLTGSGYHFKLKSDQFDMRSSIKTSGFFRCQVSNLSELNLSSELKVNLSNGRTTTSLTKALINNIRATTSHIADNTGQENRFELNFTTGF
jgi:hypothetical protein